MYLVTYKLSQDHLELKSAENASSRLIRTVSDICGPRGDDKNGCRADWLAFCEENGKKSLLTSYSSNRFKSFFLSAAAVIHHTEDLRSFLTEGFLGHSNLTIASVAPCLFVSLLNV